MSTITEIQRALGSLSAAELESIADWLNWQVEETRYRTYHVREAQLEYLSEEEPLFKVIVHRRAEDWRAVLYSGMAAQVEFRSIGLQMPMAQIYEGPPAIDGAL